MTTKTEAAAGAIPGIERLYTVAEAADLLRCHRRTVYRWIKDGTLPSVLIGRSRRITANALRHLIACA